MAGFGLGILLLKTRRIAMERHERSILDLLGLEKRAKTPVTKGDRTSRQQKRENQESKEAELEQFVRFKCNCGQRIKVSRQYMGRTWGCPKCSSQLRIPEAQDRDS
jgi:hypothetical protein